MAAVPGEATVGAQGSTWQAQKQETQLKSSVVIYRRRDWGWFYVLAVDLVRIDQVHSIILT